MRRLIEIENIEELRRKEGIDDAQLREAIGSLQAGDVVKLTFMTGTSPGAGETLPVRITCIRDNAFRGKLVDGPASTRLAQLRVGSTVSFTRDHIHSIAKRRPSRKSAAAGQVR